MNILGDLESYLSTIGAGQNHKRRRNFWGTEFPVHKKILKNSQLKEEKAIPPPQFEIPVRQPVPLAANQKTKAIKESTISTATNGRQRRCLAGAYVPIGQTNGSVLAALIALGSNIGLTQM